MGRGDRYECRFCFEEDCRGCGVLVPPVGICPVCGELVWVDEFWEKVDGEAVHWECLEILERES